MDYPQLEKSEQMLLSQRATLLEQLEVNEKQLHGVRAAKEGFRMAEHLEAERQKAREEVKEKEAE